MKRRMNLTLLLLWVITLTTGAKSMSVRRPTTPPPVTGPHECYHEGKTYTVGQFKPSPCIECHCQPYSSQAMCIYYDCAALPCVDYVTEPGQCCAVCRNGPNCRLNERIIPAGEPFVDGNRVCNCPEYESSHWRGSQDTDAVCSDITTTTPQSVCHHDGKTYETGEVFSPSPCVQCHCPGGSSVAVCVNNFDCPHVPCVDAVTKPGECCPSCPNGPNCNLEGKVIPVGVNFTDTKGRTCMCPDPIHESCHPSELQAVCVGDPETPTNRCLHDGVLYEAGITFNTSTCTSCTCPLDGGEIVCTDKVCQQLNCVDAVTLPDQCCPSCPTGLNCLLGAEVIKVGQEIERGAEVCWCPEVWAREADCRPITTKPDC